MKTIIVTMSFIVLGLTTAYAEGTPIVAQRIQKALDREFAGCESVKWLKVKDYQQATFIFHESLIVAYFNEDGELLGSARSVIPDQLPLSVLRSFDKKLADAEIVEILEITNLDGTSYWLSLDKENKRYHARVSSDGSSIRFFK